jgi:hypothetical protein
MAVAPILYYRFLGIIPTFLRRSKILGRPYMKVIPEILSILNRVDVVPRDL